MLGMGWNEIMVVMLIAVVVIGPKHLPEVAKGLGKAMAYFRRASNDLRDAINSEIAEHDEAKELRDFTRTFDTEMYSIERTAKDYVEREIEKEEAELKKLTDEAGEPAADTGTASAAAEALPSETSVMRPAAPAVDAAAPAADNASDAPAASGAVAEADAPPDEPGKKASAS